MALANAALGLVLLAGGLGLRAHRDWGRRAVLWSVWLSLAATLLAGLVGLPHLLSQSGLTLETALSLAVTPLFGAAWLVICWWVSSVLGRPEVKEACGVTCPYREARSRARTSS